MLSVAFYLLFICCYAEYRYAKWRMLNIVMLKVSMLGGIMLSVAFYLF